jgi:hypothetical protein
VKSIFGGIAGVVLLVFVVWAAIQEEKRERAEISARCTAYMEVAETASDRLHARIACDAMWAQGAAMVGVGIAGAK